jgi:hypothetical protein
MNMEASLITPLKNERAYRRGNGGEVIANNEVQSFEQIIFCI